MKRRIKAMKSDLSKIKLLLMDVDGVMTDGSVIVDDRGAEYLCFSRIDGKGLSLLKEAGLFTGVISAEKSSAVKHRMKKLNIDFVSLGTDNKIHYYEKWREKLNLNDENIAFCGDDIQDLALLRKAGWSAVPLNAVSTVKEAADYVSENTGGKGFIREICDLIISSRRKNHEQD